eukprot:6200017-Pleurochrysis_carterae.AAC.2
MFACERAFEREGRVLLSAGVCATPDRLPASACGLRLRVCACASIDCACVIWCACVGLCAFARASMHASEAVRARDHAFECARATTIIIVTTKAVNLGVVGVRINQEQQTPHVKRGIHKSKTRLGWHCDLLTDRTTRNRYGSRGDSGHELKCLVSHGRFAPPPPPQMLCDLVCASALSRACGSISSARLKDWIACAERQMRVARAQ